MFLTHKIFFFQISPFFSFFPLPWWERDRVRGIGNKNKRCERVRVREKEGE
jgi:hypothetical protein